ncbi:MAG: metallopeptidase family protein [Dehalococcoidia bacterium]|nr:metallopeptidase family protein [Dehalococcoidia bacterium]
MTSRRFARLVFKALSDIPPPFREHLTNVDVVIRRRPDRRDLRLHGIKRGERLYGMYDGVPLTERGGNYTLVPPDRITIFKEPLEADFPDETELMAEVRKTVLHEIAHFFGMSEQAVEELGMG